MFFFLFFLLVRSDYFSVVITEMWLPSDSSMCDPEGAQMQKTWSWWWCLSHLSATTVGWNRNGKWIVHVSLFPSHMTTQRTLTLHVTLTRSHTLSQHFGYYILSALADHSHSQQEATCASESCTRTLQRVVRRSLNRSTCDMAEVSFKTTYKSRQDLICRS